MNLIRLVLLLIIVSTVICCAGRRNRITIKQGNPQEFHISGIGILDDFVVSGPDHSRGRQHMKVYWEIAPLQNFDIEEFAARGPIMYGKIPAGFRQATPENGAPPPPMVDSPSYAVQLAIRNGGGVNMLFAVQGTKIVTEADAD